MPFLGVQKFWEGDPMVVDRKLPMFSAFFTSLAREAVDSKLRLGRNILFFLHFAWGHFWNFFGIFLKNILWNFFDIFFNFFGIFYENSFNFSSVSLNFLIYFWFFWNLLKNFWFFWNCFDCLEISFIFLIFLKIPLKSFWFF